MTGRQPSLPRPIHAWAIGQRLGIWNVVVLAQLRQTDCMDDLFVPPGPGAPLGLRVPAEQLVERFSRASGPGGQGVNTTDSRVQLSLNVGTTTALDAAQRERVLDHLATSLSGTILIISASEYRSQRRNRTAARQRLSALLREAVTPPVVRRPTRPTRGSMRRRLEGKRRRSQIKQHRRRPAPAPDRPARRRRGRRARSGERYPP